MILSIGEILIDDINNTLYPGGAPFNVACQINKLNGKVGFIGTVGNDIEGNFLNEFALKQKFFYLNLNKVNLKTTKAKVTIDENKDRHFKFYRDNTSDSFLSFNKEIFELNPDIVHIGSLVLSNNITKSSILKIIKYFKAKNSLISFDINYRDDIFNNIKVFSDLINYVDILKMSLDELFLYTNKNDILEACKLIARNNQIIVITLGSKGSFYYLNDEFEIVSSINVNTIDTTGAGDSFFGAFLYKYNELLKNKKIITKKDFKEILYFSNVCAALGTEKYGAIESQVGIDEILDKIK